MSATPSWTNPAPRRILVSAYACEPFKGSEPEVGLQAVIDAAQQSDVHVITRANNVETLRPYLDGISTNHPITVVGIDLSTRAKRIKKALGRLGFYWYYDRWQALAAREARALHERLRFDLVHHVTLATYWQRAITRVVDVPTILGPVGGGATTPLRLLPELGLRGIITDVVRVLTQRLWEQRRRVAETLATATVVLAQNPETADRIRTRGTIILAPNGSSGALERAIDHEPRDEILVIGRLIPYKAGALAIRAFAELGSDSTRLVFVGDGPERSRLERIAGASPAADRIEFLGRLPRDQTLARLAGARALLHPALHDDSPLTVAEALSLGTPVVCLDRGGPPVLCALWPDELSEVVPVAGRSETIRGLASALGRVVSNPPPRASAPIPPLRTFADQLGEAREIATRSTG